MLETLQPGRLSESTSYSAAPPLLYPELFIQEGSSGKVLPSPSPKRKVSHAPALQQKYYSVNTMALGMSVGKVKKSEVKRKA